MWIIETAERRGGPFTFRILPGSIKTVGRAARADFIVDAALVSRVHCRLTAGATELEVVDLDSTNGTFVNGERATRATLKSGDRLGVGRVELRSIENVRLGTDSIRVRGRSSSASPWPDQTTVSSGKLKSTSRIERSSVSMSPPGRSVRPIEPAKSVSPTKSVDCLSRPPSPTARQTPPGQCPGVWRTRTA